MRCEPIDGPVVSARPSAAKRSCVGCGCTGDNACPGGCSWVSLDPPFCSACLNRDGAAETSGAAAIDGDSGLYGAERCPGSATPALHIPIYVDETTGYCVRCRQGFVT